MATAKIKLPDGTWTTISLGPKGADGRPGDPGPPGPPGPPGTPGTGSVEFEVHFASPVYQWVVPHNLHTTALTVQAFTSSGELLDADVDFIDDDTAIIEWYYPTSGTARVFR